MKITPKLFLTLILGAAVAAVIAATHLGRWLCRGDATACYFSPAGTPAPVVSMVEAIIALTTIQRETPIVANNYQWQSGDWVTICDGANCIDLAYAPSGTWILKAGTIPYVDNGKGYKNVVVTPRGPVGGSRPSMLEIMAGPIRFFDSYGTPVRVQNPSVTVIQGAQGSNSFGASFDFGGMSNSDAFVHDFAQGGGVVCNYGGCRNMS